LIKIRIAELNVEIHNHYAFCERFCRGYIADFEKADITVSVTHEELEQERELSPYPTNYGYLESVCVYRKIAMQLSHFQAMVFHASVVECDGRAYAFAAHSGTGKSTHTNLWLKVFGKRARIINGDKPILRLKDGTWYAYGTPWCGKESLGCNTSSPLAAICFIERDKENHIKEIDGGEMVGRIFSQVLMPSNIEIADRHLALLDALVNATPTYLLHCNMLPEAAIVAHNGMAKGEST
jgi:hypothetical protein